MRLGFSIATWLFRSSWYASIFSDPYNRKLYEFVRQQLGHAPRRLVLYLQAMRHRSCLRDGEFRHATINERLEYLGDAVLGLCVAELLYKAYPEAEEGMLTNLRSKIVNTVHLAHLADQLGMTPFVCYRGRGLPSRNVVGDALEAFIGAVYLDQGYRVTKYFVQRRILAPHVSFDMLRRTTLNYKGQMVQWAQQRSRHLEFDTQRVVSAPATRRYRTTLRIDEEVLAEAHASSKKEAQRLAAKAAFDEMEARGEPGAENRHAE